MNSIWKWSLSLDMASIRLLAIAALGLNYVGACAAKNPDPNSWSLWIGGAVYFMSTAALVLFMVSATSQARDK